MREPESEEDDVRAPVWSPSEQIGDDETDAIVIADSVRAARRSPIARAELTRRLGRTQADSGLREDLAVLARDTTDDLGPIRG